MDERRERRERRLSGADLGTASFRRRPRSNSEAPPSHFNSDNTNDEGHKKPPQHISKPQ